MSRKRLRKSTWLTLALFIYVSAMAVYFLPRNTEISDNEKYITVGAAYVIVFALWFVLRKKEKYKEKLEMKGHYMDMKEEKEKEE